MAHGRAILAAPARQTGEVGDAERDMARHDRMHRAPVLGFFIDTVEWTSNGDRRRPRFAERTDILDPTAGYGQGERETERLRTERGELPQDEGSPGTPPPVASAGSRDYQVVILAATARRSGPPRGWSARGVPMAASLVRA